MIPFRTIDMAAGPRSGQFAYFRSCSDPNVGVTVNCDITPLAEVRPFFLTILYCAVQAANAVPELRRRIRGDTVVEYERCLSSHTLALPGDTYCYCQLDCAMDYAAFLPYAVAQVDQARQAASLKDEDPGALFFVSSLPWLSFTGLHHPVTNPPDSNPRITFGKAFWQEGRYLLPLNLTANHALVDGIHIAHFFQAFQEKVATLL